MQMRVSRTERVGPCRFENLLFWSPTGYQGRRFLGQKRCMLMMRVWLSFLILASRPLHSFPSGFAFNLITLFFLLQRKKGRRGLGHAMEGSVPGQKVCLNMNKETKLGKGRENG